MPSAIESIWAANPFWLLELEPGASRAEIERQGQKLLSLLELGIETAQEYSTPFGPQHRSSEAVREAVAKLRDAQTRLQYETLARLASPVLPWPAGAPVRAAWPEGLECMGVVLAKPAVPR